MSDGNFDNVYVAGRLQLGSTPNSVIPWTDGGIYFTGKNFVYRTYSLDYQSYTNRFIVDGNGHASAMSFTQTSSRELKENIAELSSEEAVETLKALNPVKFNYKADQESNLHIGFIAEDVPDLVAKTNRKGLSAMDIVAVLTKAMKEQQKTITALIEKVNRLEAKTH